MINDSDQCGTINDLWENFLNRWVAHGWVGLGHDPSTHGLTFLGPARPIRSSGRNNMIDKSSYLSNWRCKMSALTLKLHKHDYPLSGTFQKLTIHWTIAECQFVYLHSHRQLHRFVTVIELKSFSHYFFKSFFANDRKVITHL